METKEAPFPQGALRLRILQTHHRRHHPATTTPEKNSGVRYHRQRCGVSPMPSAGDSKQAAGHRRQNMTRACSSGQAGHTAPASEAEHAYY